MNSATRSASCGQMVLDIVDEFGPFVAVASPVAVIGFRTHEGTNPSDVFDPTRVLGHLAFHAADQAAIEAWEARLDEQEIPHSDVVEDPSGGLHLNFKDPDTIALEFHRPAPQGWRRPFDDGPGRGCTGVMDAAPTPPQGEQR
ncbi:hypothetical protein ACFY8W_33335 [Streptomyces sp. NPDC012637]|uniref:hypothetical protein n=1 Tax=Streptomyces sp. NPDC012637 TaxID=3364842 RepID=UPI0036E7FC1E